MGPLTGSWWKKQARVLGAPSPDLGILKAREPRLQKTEAEGLASGLCARRGDSKSKGHLLHLGLVLCSHSCLQGPELAPPSCCCNRNASTLLATPTCPPRDQARRAPEHWEERSRLSLGKCANLSHSRPSLALGVATIARWESVVGTTAPPPGLLPPHSELSGLSLS